MKTLNQGIDNLTEESAKLLGEEFNKLIIRFLDEHQNVSRDLALAYLYISVIQVSYQAFSDLRGKESANLVLTDLLNEE